MDDKVIEKVIQMEMEIEKVIEMAEQLDHPLNKSNGSATTAQLCL